MNIYVICTPLDLLDVEKHLNDTNSLVMYPQECLYVLQSDNEAPYVVSTCPDPDKERINVVPLCQETVDFNNIDLLECPACAWKMEPQESWENGYCNRCGFTWEGKKMWFELNTLEEEGGK
jgi:hypothetical protein